MYLVRLRGVTTQSGFDHEHALVFHLREIYESFALASVCAVTKELVRVGIRDRHFDHNVPREIKMRMSGMRQTGANPAIVCHLQVQVPKCSGNILFLFVHFLCLSKGK